MKLNKLKKKLQKGFTMIELVIVIAILGVLAAFALPRFANFTTQAKDSASQHIIGSVNASVGIVKAKYLAQGSTGTTVDLNGRVIPVTNSGDLKIESYDDCAVVFQLTELVQSEYGINFSSYSNGDKICRIFSYKNRGSFKLSLTGATPDV